MPLLLYADIFGLSPLVLHHLIFCKHLSLLFGCCFLLMMSETTCMEIYRLVVSSLVFVFALAVDVVIWWFAAFCTAIHCPRQSGWQLARLVVVNPHCGRVALCFLPQFTLLTALAIIFLSQPRQVHHRTPVLTWFFYLLSTGSSLLLLCWKPSSAGCWFGVDGWNS